MYGATIGKFGIIAKESTTNQACCALIYNPDSLFNSAYAFGYLLTEREKIISLGQGSAQPNISQQVIKKLSILKPSENIIRKYKIHFTDKFKKMFIASHQNIQHA